MKFTKRFIVSVCLLLCFASSAFCIDPFAANEGGFGPKVKGFQLGQKVSLGDLVAFIINNLDNVDASDRVCRIRSQIIGQINIRLGKNGFFAISNYGNLKKEDLENHNLSECISKLEELSASDTKLEVNFAFEYLPGSVTFELSRPSMRLSKIALEKSLFGASELTHKEFLQEFINAYNIPTMKAVDSDRWRYRNPSQGYQVEYNGYRGAGRVDITPIVTKSAFD